MTDQNDTNITFSTMYGINDVDVKVTQSSDTFPAKQLPPPVIPSNAPETKTGLASKEWYCKYCQAVVMTYTSGPVKLGSINSPPIKCCQHCSRPVIGYTVQELANHLHEQMKLLAEATAITTLNKALAAENKALKSPKYLDMVTGHTIPEGNPGLSKSGHFHADSQKHPTVKLDDEGFIKIVERLKKAEEVEKTTLAEKNAEIAELKAKVSAMQETLNGKGIVAMPKVEDRALPQIEI